MTRHPAKFTDVILERALAILEPRLPEGALVLDPFAGTGKGPSFLRANGIDAVGVELEPEWANMDPFTVQGDALHLPWPDDIFDAVFTSPCYGNRMSDHHNARDASRRNTYTHAIGHALHDGNAGAMQWGPEYRALHLAAWAEAARVLAPGGLLLINVKDHIRKGQRVFVSEWHFLAALKLGFVPMLTVHVPTPGNRFGANGDARVDGESLMLFGWEPSSPVLQSTLVARKGTQ